MPCPFRLTFTTIEIPFQQREHMRRRVRMENIKYKIRISLKQGVPLGLLLGLWSAGIEPFARADETPFGYVYTTDSLPQGKWEYEQWNTVRTKKPQGTYT